MELLRRNVLGGNSCERCLGRNVSDVLEGTSPKGRIRATSWVEQGVANVSIGRASVLMINFLRQRSVKEMTAFRDRE